MNKDYLDEKTRRAVWAREFKCFTCGVTTDLEVGHFISRRFLATRWDLDNCHLQCKRCNRELHGNLKVYEERLRAAGIDPDKLREKSRTKISPGLVSEYYKRGEDND